MANGQRLIAKKNIHQYCWARIARQYLVCDIVRKLFYFVENCKKNRRFLKIFEDFGTITRKFY